MQDPEDEKTDLETDPFGYRKPMQLSQDRWNVVVFTAPDNNPSCIIQDTLRTRYGGGWKADEQGIAALQT